jgi:hypothetical protein
VQRDNKYSGFGNRHEEFIRVCFTTLTIPGRRIKLMLNDFKMNELDKIMYFKATPGILENARRLRENMTDYEKLLWEKLKRKQICGLRFRRQHPIDIFIADFYCHEVRLVVEID